jgi:predicted glycosyltransferase
LRIAVDIGHPAQVHFWKNFVWEMEKRGHQIFISASDKDVATKLLKAYGLPFTNLGSYGDTMFKKIRRVPIKDLALYRAVRPFKPDFFVGLGSLRAVHVSWLMRKPCVVFEDDEFSYPYYHWFAKSVCGFSGFKLTGKKIIKIPGYKELAYLHPNRFNPGEASGNKEKTVLLRFVSWTSFHDSGQKGFDLNFKRRLVEELSKYASVYISSEEPLPAELDRCKLAIPPEEMHTFLAKADLLVSESETMTTEAAVLGTPVVRCNSYVCDDDKGNFVQLEQRYHLIYSFRDPEAALQKALELIKTPGLKEMWKSKRQHLLSEKIDVTAFMIWLIENYPDSFNALKAVQPLEIAKGSPQGIPLKEWVLADG